MNCQKPRSKASRKCMLTTSVLPPTTTGCHQRVHSSSEMPYTTGLITTAVIKDFKPSLRDAISHIRLLSLLSCGVVVITKHHAQANTHRQGTPVSRAMRPVNHVVERFIPSSLVFSIVPTFIVVVLALILTETSPGDLVVYWGDGLAGLLDFITQMALILLFGHILANTGPV